MRSISLRSLEPGRARDCRIDYLPVAWKEPRSIDLAERFGSMRRVGHLSFLRHHIGEKCRW